MKLPSLNYLITSANRSLKRFPLTILCAAVAVGFGIFLTENVRELDNSLPFINAMLCMSIGIPLFFCIGVVSEKWELGALHKRLVNAAGIVVLVILYFTFPGVDSTHNTSLPYIKYALYNITCHLLVSFVPFLFKRQLNAFWHYNKILFLRFLAAVLYSGVLYLGIVLALTALNLLFDVDIHDELYMDIWIFIIGFFNTWFFVSGIPEEFDSLEEIEVYPKGLRIFSQYVLLPLLGLYLLILYAYGAKILMLWDWPRGIVSYLIIIVSVLGIFDFLLLYPYGKQEEFQWIKKLSKIYYLVLIPLLVILYIAIFMRINDYGITINRYVILILGVWLTITCIYTVMGRTNIKFIPTSLAVITLLISLGPWGMFAVSEKSQVNRLKEILSQSKILIDEKVTNETIWAIDSLPKLYEVNKESNEGKLPDSLHNEVLSILDYLDDHHGFSSIRGWYSQNIDSISGLKDTSKFKYYRTNEADLYMRSLGLKYSHIYKQDSPPSINFNAADNVEIIGVSGYDYFMSFSRYDFANRDRSMTSFLLGKQEYQFEVKKSWEMALDLINGKDTLTFDMKQLVKNLRLEYGDNPKTNIPKEKMELFEENNYYQFKIELQHIEADSVKDKLHLQSVSGNLFIKIKKGN